MTVAILASPIITILAPSLNSSSVNTMIRTLAVPTLNTTTDAVQNDVYLSESGGYGTITEMWAALAAIISATPVGWPMPDGCSPQCSYYFTYAAPAVRCTDLQPDEIDDGVQDIYRFVSRTFQDPPAAYLLAYDALSVGAGYQSSPYSWTLAYVPFLASNVVDGALISASGSVCVFYNATHLAHTHYFNGTQESSVTVTEFHEPLNTTYEQGGFALDWLANSTQFERGPMFLPGIGGQIHLLAMADSISAHLNGFLKIDGHFGTLTTTTLLTETNIFEPYDVEALAQVHSANPRMNTTASVTNVSQALQDLVANVTLGFVNLLAGNTTLDALVESADLVYVYNRKTLIATYLAAFVVLAAMNAVGVFCIIKNGGSSTNSFSRFLLATRNWMQLRML
ncbi:hypothetical protein C8R47DRAFT_1131480 [Mycena vitilis]|nr:hypothetical protein C8R47DRAFT_1131480 [Mycena vitilis]